MKNKAEKEGEDARLYREIVENMAEGVFLIRASDGVIVYANPTIERIFGYEHGELIGKRTSVLDAPTDKSPEEAAQEIIHGLKNNGIWQGEVQNIKKDGTVFWCYANISTFEHPQYGNVWIAINQDITERKQAEKSLQESEERYRTLVETQPYLICRWLPDTTLTFVNKAYCDFFGKAQDELLGKSWLLLIPENNRDKKSKYCAELTLHPAIQEYEHQAIASDGAICWQSWSDIPILDLSGSLLEFQSVGRDITKRRQMEEALRENEEKYRLLIENSHDLICTTTIDGVLVFVSPAWVTLLGHQVSQVIGQPFQKFIHPEDIPMLMEWMQKIIETGQRQESIEYRIQKLDGDWRWHTTSVVPLKDETGRVVRLEGSTRDITERKQAENALNEEYNFRTAIENSMQAGVAAIDMEGKQISVNRYFSKMVGWTAEELIGKSAPYAYWPSDELDNINRAFQLTLQGKAPESGFELKFIRKNGELFDVLVNLSALENSKNETIGWLAVVTEITASKQAEENLRKREQEYKTLVENTPDVIVRFDQQYRHIYVNPAVEKEFGTPPAEFLGKTHRECGQSPEMADWSEGLIRRVFETGREITFELTNPTPTGNKYYLARGVPEFAEDGSVASVLFIHHNVTRHKLAENALRESEERFRLAFQNNPEGMTLTSIDSRFLQVNPALCIMLGYSEQELLAKTFQDVTFPDDRHLSADLFRQMLAGERDHANFEKRYVRKDGALVWIFINTSPVRDLDGKTLYFVSQMQDITQRRQAEEKLRQAEAKYRDIFENAIEGIFQSAPDGHFISVNAAMARIFGYDSPEDMIASIGNNIPTRIYADTNHRGEFISILAQTGSVKDFEAKNLRKDGSVIRTRTNARAIRGANGAVLYYEGFLEDVTERKQAEEALRESHERFSLFMRHSPFYVYIKETTPTASRLLQVSDNFQELTGIPIGDMIGKNIEELFPTEFTAKVTADDLAVITSGETLKLDEYFNGRHYTTIKFPLVQGDKTLLAGYTIDITERKRAEEALRESEKRFSTAFHASPIAQVITVIDSGLIQDINEAFSGLMGYTSAELIGHTSKALWMDFKDRKNMVEQLILDGSMCNMELQFVNRSGQLRNVIVSIAMIELKGEKCMISTLLDITERKQAEKQLWESERRFHTAQDISLDAFTILQSIRDEQGKIVDFVLTYANPIAGQILKQPPERLIGQRLLEILPGNRDNKALFKRYARIVETGQGDDVELEYHSEEINGWFRNMAVKLGDGVANAFNDITERKRTDADLREANKALQSLHVTMREMAIRDPLTGLYNRRYLYETLEREISRAERENAPLSVIMSDLDLFKMINDTYGHQVGDKFLVEIASLMKHHARGSDIVCRYGGEEFLLVLPGTALDSAEKRAEEIRQKCAEIIIQHERKELKVTMSFGVAAYPNHGKEAEEIVIKADKALYQSKDAGRNRVTIWDEEAGQ